MNIVSSAILTYHSIDDSGSVISVPPTLFRSHLAVLRDAGTPVVPLDQLHTTPGSIAITFDDGFRSFAETAFPVLQQYGFPATVFVVSEYCGKRNDWPSQPAGIPSFDLMDWAELRDIARCNVSLGGHSATHPRMTGLREDQIRHEIFDSRAKIEDRAGVPVTAFAYPYGDSDSYVRRLVARAHRLACGTALRFLQPDDNPFELPRIDAFYIRNVWTMRNLLGPGGRAYIRARGLMRSARTALAG
jgi:peptidoglycan/xylan/chitin deacetylase (PgdA/CDA1 family)